ncbi:MAG: hypothetical protein IJT59_04260 [Desulfovibrionaceae bacterium]|nr:hypothetical protein [Desulfovibrionaceae bacterium]
MNGTCFRASTGSLVNSQAVTKPCATIALSTKLGHTLGNSLEKGKTLTEQSWKLKVKV